MEKCCAIVLAAGKGKRMNSDVRKQYLLIDDKPVLWYALNAFEKSFVQEVVLVVSKDDKEYVQTEIVEHFGFKKVKAIVEGGKERYHSVACGIKAIESCDYLFIHDGARPFVTQDMLERLLDDVKKTQACVAAVPAKDTIKIANENGFAKETPNRNLVWQVQTPQVFAYPLIQEGYHTLLAKEQELQEKGIQITDDAMVVEVCMKHQVKMTMGDYRNIKMTTPEDLLLAQSFIAN